MTEQKPLGLNDYIEIGLRRKWYLIIPIILCFLSSIVVYRYLPKIYRATTLILVQPQKVPESYVRPTITETVLSRLNTISQEILSRTRLEKVIEEFNLYPELRKKAPMEEVVETMRKAIEVKVQTGLQKRGEAKNAFTISYEGHEPRTVMLVTNKLASLFIEENLKVRETQAERTSEFITKELISIEEQLKKKEEDIRRFKERAMGELPEQLEANLRILERLQQQLRITNENIRASEDRAILLQTQIEQLKNREPAPVTPIIRKSSDSSRQDLIISENMPQDPVIIQYNNLKRDLANAQSKYKDTHPDVMDLKRKIANLEPKVKELIEKFEAEKQAKLKMETEGVIEYELPPPKPDPNIERLIAQFTEQYNNAVLEARRSNEELKNLKDQIAFYQRRVENTPKREQELKLLTRDYDLLKANYQSLLDKKIQAQMAENLERKQQGEQFKILDPARIPEKPVKPDKRKVLLIGAVIGLVIGFGLTWFRESLDRSFHTVSEVENYLGIPVIATIPNFKAEAKKKAA